MTAPLPNPSLVFVPLDILTADELNQICQNVSYLAGLFPIQTANIAAGAINSDVIDYTSLKKWTPDYSQKSNLTLDSNGKATISQNGWVIYHYFGYTINDSHTIEILVNDTLVFQQLQEARSTTGASAVYGDTMFPVSTGDVITQTGATQEHTAIFIPGKWV